MPNLGLLLDRQGATCASRLRDVLWAFGYAGLAFLGTIDRLSETREPLRLSFDSAADLYGAARPSYPRELFDDLVDLAKPQPLGTTRSSEPLSQGAPAGCPPELSTAYPPKAEFPASEIV
jgi:hypothetical protein